MEACAQPIARQQHLAFTIAGTEYAVPILGVREIVRYEDVVPVPSAPPAIRGYITVRGHSLPILDLAARFGLAESRATARACILVVELVLEGSPLVIGLVVDAVGDVVELGPRDIQGRIAWGGAAAVEWIRGLGNVHGKLVLLLDLEKAIAAEEHGLPTARA
jgi:purine-binding chemotaxis protein CheW